MAWARAGGGARYRPPPWRYHPADRAPPSPWSRIAPDMVWLFLAQMFTLVIARQSYLPETER